MNKSPAQESGMLRGSVLSKHTVILDEALHGSQPPPNALPPTHSDNGILIPSLYDLNRCDTYSKSEELKHFQDFVIKAIVESSEMKHKTHLLHHIQSLCDARAAFATSILAAENDRYSTLLFSLYINFRSLFKPIWIDRLGDVSQTKLYAECWSTSLSDVDVSRM